MITVKLFGGLRAHTQEHALEVPGDTVGVVLARLCEGRAGLQEALFIDGILQPYVRVMVNGRDVELDQGLQTAVSPGDQIAIFPPIAGG